MLFVFWCLQKHSLFLCVCVCVRSTASTPLSRNGASIYLKLVVVCAVQNVSHFGKAWAPFFPITYLCVYLSGKRSKESYIIIQSSYTLIFLADSAWEEGPWYFHQQRQILLQDQFWPAKVKLAFLVGNCCGEVRCRTDITSRVYVKASIQPSPCANHASSPVEKQASFWRREKKQAVGRVQATKSHSLSLFSLSLSLIRLPKEGKLASRGILFLGESYPR